MTLPMLRILPPPWDFRMMTASQAQSVRDVSEVFCSDKYESLRKLSMIPQPPKNPNKPLTSFRINDILSSESENLSTQKPSHKSTHKQTHVLTASKHSNGQHRHSVASLAESLKHHKSAQQSIKPVRRRSTDNKPNRVLPPPPPTRIVRPWDASPSPGKFSEASSEADEEEINVDDDDNDDDDAIPTKAVNLKDVSPLDALMEMANKTFQGLETSEAADAKRREQAALFGKHATPKKRRKSRTAFTNQQIYELEKRFLYQKYLTPADRDEIAQNLNLTNAQVITWFQNRRAKLKRDLEELKNDVVATKQLSTKSGSSDHEFSIDSDTDSSCRPLHMSPKRTRSVSKSPEPETNRPSSTTHAQSPVDSMDEHCESGDEIVVDDRGDEIDKEQET